MITLVLWSIKKNFFSDHSFEKLYRQNDDRDIVILSKFFIENPHKVDPHQNKFFWLKTKKKLYYSKFPPKMPFHACFSYINKHLLKIWNVTIYENIYLILEFFCKKNGTSLQFKTNAFWRFLNLQIDRYLIEKKFFKKFFAYINKKGQKFLPENEAIFLFLLFFVVATKKIYRKFSN